MKLLNKIYYKNKIAFTLIWIFIYVLGFSFGDYLSSLININKLFTLIIGLFLSLILLLFLKKNNLFTTYGLNKTNISSRYMLFYIPCIIMLSSNMMFGVTLLYSPLETILYILSMFCVGFLEELIFRGLLFNSMKEDNLKVAIIVSSLTFGIGHIVNLFNGSSSNIILTLLQIIYATGAGFMFVMIYYRSNSIIPCIIFHALFNGLSAFSKSPNDILLNIFSCIILTLITGGYAIYLTIKKIKSNI